MVFGIHGSHEAEETQVAPSESRRKLSQQLLADETPAGDYGRPRRASGMSMALAVMSQDEEVAKRSPPVLIMGQLFFERALDRQKVKTALKTRLLQIPRFRCILQQSNDKAICFKALPIDLIDIDYHLSAPQPSSGKAWTRTGVDEFCSGLYKMDKETGLDYQNPPWRFYIFTMDDGRTLLMPVIDHALADGVAAVAALMSILDDDPNHKGEAAAPMHKRMAGPSMSVSGRIHAVLVGLKDAFLGPMLPADTRTFLKEKDHLNPHLDKACAAGERVSLDEMKRVKAKFAGASVNDIMLATLTITLQRYFKEKGEECIPIRGNFPINMRSAKDNVLKTSMGNRFAPGNFTFPMTERDYVRMVWAIKGQVDTIKNSPAPVIQSALFGWLLPKLTMGGKKSREAMLQLLLDSYGKVTVMLSNVPGPSQQVSFCDQPIESLMFYAFAPIGAYFGILSYAGSVSLGLTVGTAIDADAAKLAKHWAPAFKELVEAIDAAPAKSFAPPKSKADLVLGVVATVGVAWLLKRRLRF